jgi:hypothetical protein
MARGGTAVGKQHLPMSVANIELTIDPQINIMPNTSVTLCGGGAQQNLFLNPKKLHKQPNLFNTNASSKPEKYVNILMPVDGDSLD